MNKSNKAIQQMHCVYNLFIDMAENLLESFAKTNISIQKYESFF